MELADLRLLLAVWETGSITGAARQRHLSLPAASARVRLLERHVGAALFDRHRRGVNPTPVGSTLITHAREVISAAERLDEELATCSDGGWATVRMLVNTAASAALTDILGDFLTLHPTARIDLDEQPSTRIVKALADGRAEIGIVADSVDLGSLSRSVLRDDPIAAITSRNDPAIDTGPISFEQLLEHPFIGLTRANPLQDHIDGHAMPYGQRPTYRLRLPTIDAVCTAVAGAVGIAILPAHAVSHRRDIRTNPITDQWANRRLMLCTTPPHGHYGPLSATAQQLHQHIDAAFHTAHNATGARY